MTEPAADLARRTPDALDKIVGTGDTRAMLTELERNVRDVIDIARDRGFVTRFNNRDFFGFPAWSLLALTYGLVPFVEWTKPVDGGWEARAVVRTREGDVVAAAEAMCTRKEQSRRSADDHTLRAMAQTRAMRNALRSCLGAALVMAGFDFADPEGPATNEQVGLLHQLEREIGMSHDEGHAMAKVDSYKQLNREDASTLIDRWTAMRDELRGGGAETPPPSNTTRANGPRPGSSDASEGLSASTSAASDTEGSPATEQTVSFGEGEPDAPEAGDSSPASDEAWSRAPKDMSLSGAVKLAVKLRAANLIPAPVPKKKSDFTGEQLTKVAAAWRDGERG
jgi:hypothetical protein